MKERIVRVADKVVEYSLYGLIFSIPISTAAIEIFAGLAILAFILKKAIQPEFEFIRNRAHLFLLFFFIFCGLSLFNSGPHLKTSLGALFFKWLEYIFIFLIVEDTLANQKRLRNVITIFLFVGVVVGIDALLQRFLGYEFLRVRPMRHIRGSGMYAITGPFKHYNDFAAYLVCVLSLVIALFLTKMKKKIYRFGIFFAIALLGLCLLFSFSRGAWLGFSVAILMMLILSHKKKFPLLIICIFMILIFFLPIIKERTILIFQASGDGDRFKCWQAALAMIRENPFLGKGLGTFMANLRQYSSTLFIQYAHNCYLQMWAEIGIFGLLSFLLFVGSILYKGIRVLRDGYLRGQSQVVLLGLICALFGFLAHSFLDTQLYSLQLSVLFWFLLGMVAGFI